MKLSCVGQADLPLKLSSPFRRGKNNYLISVNLQYN